MLYIEAHKPAQHSPENAGLQMRGIDQSYDSSTSHNNIVDMLACVAAQRESVHTEPSRTHRSRLSVLARGLGRAPWGPARVLKHDK